MLFSKCGCPYILGTNIQIDMLSQWIFSFDEYEVFFPITFDNFWLNMYIIGYQNGYSKLLIISLYLEKVLTTVYSKNIYLFGYMCCLYATES